MAVAQADAYIITVCCLPCQEKKALMNLPWLPVFSTIIPVAHIQYMWQVAVNAFGSFSCSVFQSLSLTSSSLLFLQRSLSVPLSSCVPSPSSCSTPLVWQWSCQLQGCQRRESKHCISISRCSISLAFMPFDCRNNWLWIQGIKDDGNHTRKIQTGKTIRCNPNEPDKYTQNTHTQRCASSTHPPKQS